MKLGRINRDYQKGLISMKVTLIFLIFIYKYQIFVGTHDFTLSLAKYDQKINILKKIISLQVVNHELDSF